MTERGYPTDRHGPVCGCKDEAHELAGPCVRITRDKKDVLCTPCGHKWHWQQACPEYQSKGYPTLTTICRVCGYDSAHHPLSERQRSMYATNT